MSDCIADTRLLMGDVRAKLKELPDESVHCVVTSPPYWGLRDYGVEGQIGLEPTPEEHIETLVEVFREVRRVLRKDGVCWINYGDCYACAPNGRKAADIEGDDRCFRDKPFGTVGGALKPKDLVGMPWRVALALQADGWWLRCDVIWHKPNPLPESVTDRPTRAHEYLFLLARAERYYYDADAVREMACPDSFRLTKNRPRGEQKNAKVWHIGAQHRSAGEKMQTNPPGRNRRSVWTIPSQALRDEHYAAFPEALVEPCILAGTSDWGCCPACGAPWKRVVERTPMEVRSGLKAGGYGSRSTDRVSGTMVAPPLVVTTGWQPTCSCNREDVVPATCLDPFGGSGTVGRVANRLGRKAILIELNPEYGKLARKRTAQIGMGV